MRLFLFMVCISIYEVNVFIDYYLEFITEYFAHCLVSLDFFLYGMGAIDSLNKNVYSEWCRAVNKYLQTILPRVTKG